MSLQPRDKVKGPILIPFSLVLLVAVGALFLVAYQYEERARQQDLADSVRTVQRLFQLQLANDAAKLQATLVPISHDAGIREPMLNGDRQLLLDTAGPLFERLRERHRVTHFYILDAARRVVARVHQPGLSGDVIARSTTLQAERSGRQTQGIELGMMGTLTLRAVKPWFHQGRLIGYLELGEQIDHVAEEIHQALGVDLIVMIHRDRLAAGHAGAIADDHGGAVEFVSNTLGELPPEIAKRLRGLRHAVTGAQDTIAGARSLYTATFPLEDAAGREIGDVAVVRDVTRLQAGFRESLIAAASLSLLAGALVFTLFYAILDRVERDYRRQREMETAFARLSTEHQRIVQIEKLSEVGRTISEIAHQINNPLVGVVNLAQLADREADDPVRVRELLASIRQAGADSHAFLQRMLAFTKVSRFERKPTEITALIQETIVFFQQSSELQLPVITSLPPSPLMVGVDPVLLRHALFNLLSNAAQFSPADGEIRVRLVAMHDQAQRKGWSIEVSDRGPGFSTEVAGKLFTPFFTTQANGTGLGLAVVQHVAMLHDGSAKGENRAGGGAVFALWLPELPPDPGLPS